MRKARVWKSAPKKNRQAENCKKKYHIILQKLRDVKRFPCKYDAQLPFLTLQNAEGGPPYSLIWDSAIRFVNTLPESKGGCRCGKHPSRKTIGRRLASGFAWPPFGRSWSMLQPIKTSSVRLFLGALERCWKTVDSGGPPLQCLMMQSCHGSI